MNDYSPPYDAGRRSRDRLAFVASIIVLLGALLLLYFKATPPSPCAIYSTTESRA